MLIKIAKVFFCSFFFSPNAKMLDSVGEGMRFTALSTPDACSEDLGEALNGLTNNRPYE